MRKKKSSTQKKELDTKEAFKVRKGKNPLTPANAVAHHYGKNRNVCLTDSCGYSTPRNRNPAELVLDASEGFIPLWEQNVMLKWRFSPTVMNYFQNPSAAKEVIRQLFSDAILKWEDAAPIRFKETDDVWDFEIIIRPDNCNINGCTLASAFFPDGGRHQLALYPKMFSLDRKEQVETLIHEMGHIFGLRHFFANLTETAYPSVIFGEHKPFSIMNYGHKSQLTNADKSDLKKLYEKVWSGELTHINGTKIVKFLPFHCQQEMDRCAR